MATRNRVRVLIADDEANMRLTLADTSRNRGQMQMSEVTSKEKGCPLYAGATDRASRLLIVDDDPGQLSTLRAILEEEGFQVTGCATYREAHELLAAERFGIAVLDLNLDDGGGLDLLRAVRERRDRTRVIIHTAFGSFGSAKDALNLGAFAYVEKLNNPEELIAHVRQASHEFLTTALIESEIRFEGLVNDVDAIVWEADVSTRKFTFVSDHAEMLGFPAAEWLTDPDFWIKLIHPDDREQAVQHCKSCTEARRDHEFDYRAVTADGRAVWLHDVVRVVKDEKTGKPVKLRGVMINIDRRKRAELALARRLHVEELVAELSTGLISLPTAELGNAIDHALERFGSFIGAGSAQLLQFSEDRSHLRRTNGWRCEEPGDGSDFEVPAAAVPWLVQMIEAGEALALTRVSELPGAARAERELLFARGVQSLICVPIHIEGAAVGCACFERLRHEKEWPEELVSQLKLVGEIFANALARKASEEERLRLELQLRHSQKMEALGQLAGGVAHDFNNLLTTILGNAELLADLAPAEGQIGYTIAEIQKATERAASLTGQLLAFSRRQSIKFRALDLNDVIRNLEGMLLRLLGERVDLEIALTPDVELVDMDAGQMEQVVVNLAVNARDAMPNGGKLILETARACACNSDFCESELVSAGAVLKVTDTGVGIDPAIRDHLFEPFFTTKPPGSGTGLGLSTAYGIVRQAGGCITVDSEPGRGTVFSVYLPLSSRRINETADEGDSERDSSSTSAGDGDETVLVCEDEPTVRKLTCTVLAKSGYNVMSAENGERAIELLEESGRVPDLLLTDTIMPAMNGRELADRLRKSHPDLPVLFMSGYPRDVFESQSQGVVERTCGFIQKPFDTRTLLEGVRALLDAERSRSKG